jgi:hypothetical protein
MGLDPPPLPLQGSRAISAVGRIRYAMSCAGPLRQGMLVDESVLVKSVANLMIIALEVSRAMIFDNSLMPHVVGGKVGGAVVECSKSCN